MNEWQRVWAEFDKRRVALGWSWNQLYERTDVSESSFRMRNGHPLKSRAKQSSACVAVGWSGDSFDLIRRGVPPEVVASTLIINSRHERRGGIQRGLGSLVPAEVNQPTRDDFETLTARVEAVEALHQQVVALAKEVRRLQRQLGKLGAASVQEARRARRRAAGSPE